MLSCATLKPLSLGRVGFGCFTGFTVLVIDCGASVDGQLGFFR